MCGEDGDDDLCILCNPTPPLKSAMVHIGTPEDMGRRFIDAWHRAERGEEVNETHITLPAGDWPPPPDGPVPPGPDPDGFPLPD